MHHYPSQYNMTLNLKKQDCTFIYMVSFPPNTSEFSALFFTPRSSGQSQQNIAESKSEISAYVKHCWRVRNLTRKYPVNYTIFLLKVQNQHQTIHDLSMSMSAFQPIQCQPSKVKHHLVHHYHSSGLGNKCQFKTKYRESHISINFQTQRAS